MKKVLKLFVFAVFVFLPFRVFAASNYTVEMVSNQIGNKVVGTYNNYNAALNATAAASTGDSPYKIYFKQQLPTIIVAPILFVLAATGILAQVGFFIGNYLTNWIGSLI